MTCSGLRMLMMLLAASKMAPVPVMGQLNATIEEDALAPVTSMNAGSFHTAVIIRDSMVNVVKAWGANGKGQLGLNDTKDRGDNDGDVGDLLPEVVLGTNLQAVAITCGLRHTAALLDDGSVRSWGYNGKGQLGIGNLLDVGDGPDEMGDNLVATELGEGLVPTTISSGGWHTCAILEEQMLKCWGYNQWGELGLGDNDDRGDEPNEMGDNLGFVDLGDNDQVLAIALGDWHTCAILEEGNVKCFGKNFAGQLGLDDANIRGDEPGEMGNNLPSVNLGGKKASAIACGEEHTCAILEDGELRCWGLGSSGQLGQGNPQNVGDTQGDMDSLVGIDLGTGRTAVEVTAGGNHTCALLDNDDIKCWGDNFYGELGQGDRFSRGMSPDQMGDNLAPIPMGTGWKVHSLSAGYYHTCALVDQEDAVSSVLCWGANFKGQIGLGTSETEHVGDGPDEMGDNLELANLGGNHMDESGDKWYKKTWFYITCGVAGGVLLCCLCLLCKRAHGDNSGRGVGKLSIAAAAGAASKTTEEGADPEGATPTDSNGTNPNTTGAAAHTAGGSPADPSAALCATVVTSPKSAIVETSPKSAVVETSPKSAVVETSPTPATAPIAEVGDNQA